MMENQTQMQPGTWDRINTETRDKVKFDVNITQRVVVLNPIPKESVGDNGGVYYTFEIEQDKRQKVIQTSAWTLLKELKALNLKPGMTIDITKKLVKGKQLFEVKEVKP